MFSQSFPSRHNSKTASEIALLPSGSQSPNGPFAWRGPNPTPGLPPRSSLRASSLCSVSFPYAKNRLGGISLAMGCSPQESQFPNPSKRLNSSRRCSGRGRPIPLGAAHSLQPNWPVLSFKSRISQGAMKRLPTSGAKTQRGHLADRPHETTRLAHPWRSNAQQGLRASPLARPGLAFPQPLTHDTSRAPAIRRSSDRKLSWR